MSKVPKNKPGAAKGFRRWDAYRTRARAQIYLKDPLALSKKGALPVGFAIVGGDTSIAPGPTSSRFMVVDYDASSDRVYAPTLPRETRLVQWIGGRGERLIDFRAPKGTRGETQINAWATAVDTLELFQQPIALGREVPWASETSRLRILPQGMYEANAYYSRDTRALHFGYFDDGRRLVKTALSHDIVAHETAHAILDGLRPFYLEATHPDTAAFHEYTGDLAAMLSLFRQREFVSQLVDVSPHQPTFFDLVANLAPEVGRGLYRDADRSFLRTARNKKKYEDVEEETDPHVRCQVLTGLAFDLFRDIFDLRGKTPLAVEFGETKQTTFANLVTTARHVVQMLLRPLDLLPPGRITFPEYASIILKIDGRFHPDDKLGYRHALERLLKQRGLHPEQFEYQWYIDSEAPEDRRLRERDIAMIRSSRVGAYRFLDANRKGFRIDSKRDFRVVGLATNRRELNRGYLPPPETIIQYVWEEYVPLPKDVRTTALDHAVVRGGGTVVVDESVNVVHWSHQPVKPSTRDDARLHLVRLLERRDVDLAPMRGLRSARPVVAVADSSGGLRLFLNTARMHRGRAGV